MDVRLHCARLGGTGGQVEPLVAAVGNRWQTAPIYHAVVVVQVKRDGRRRPVDKVQAPLASLPLEAKPANPATRNAIQVVVAIPEREKDQIDQALGAAFQVTAEAEQALPVTAEGIEPNGHWTAVRPEDFVAFVLDLLLAAILTRIATKENSQVACHALLSRGPIKRVDPMGSGPFDFLPAPSRAESARQDVPRSTIGTFARRWAIPSRQRNYS